MEALMGSIGYWYGSFLAITMVLSHPYPAHGQEKEHSNYLGQERPGTVPIPFGVGVVSDSDQYVFGSVFPKAADQFYYAVRLDDQWKAEIRFMEFKEGQWSSPVGLDLDNSYGYNDPFLNADGNRLYFMSNKPKKGDGKGRDSDLWYMDKEGDNWSAPINLGFPLNSEKNEYYISITDRGTLFFSSNVHTGDDNADDYDIWYAEPENGTFALPVRMGPTINSIHFDTDPFVAPDGSYLIFSSMDRSDGFGKGDLYISFKDRDNSWSMARNMGPVINTGGHEFCPFVSRDGKYLFYTSDGVIFWVSTELVENLRALNRE